jgi:hypothetical protein
MRVFEHSILRLADGLDELSPRELELPALVARGSNNGETPTRSI